MIVPALAWCCSAAGRCSGWPASPCSPRWPDYGPSILHVKPTPPMYARAIARMKFGKYSEAELEIIRELEKCEDDFEGWMMLAGPLCQPLQRPARGRADHPRNLRPAQDHAVAAFGRLASAGGLALAAGGRPGGGPPRPADDLRPPARHAPGAHGAAPHQPIARLDGRTAPATASGPEFPCPPSATPWMKPPAQPNPEWNGTRPPRRPMPASRSSRRPQQCAGPGKAGPALRRAPGPARPASNK